jgi:hypothetical protein
MAINTFTSLELDAVNYILSAVGQAPVTNLDQLNPDVAIAFDTLQQTNKQVQEEGWAFNREREYPFTPDNAGNIVIPSNILQLDLSNIYENAGIESVRRDGRLYNKTDHTYTWPGQVLCDVMWLISYDDVPPPVRQLIVTTAAMHTSQKVIGDQALYAMINDRVEEARASAIEYETSQGDYSMYGSGDNLKFYSSYQPFKTLAR